jgi:hypothetical protein
MSLLNHITSEKYISGSNCCSSQIIAKSRSIGQEFHVLGDCCGVGAEDGLIQALDATVLAYNFLVKKRFYVEAPKKLLLHTFVQANRLIFRVKKKNPSIELGFGAICVSDFEWWAVVLGDYLVFIYKNGKLEHIKLSQTFPALGKTKIGIDHKLNQFYSTGNKFAASEMILLMSKTLAQTVNEKRIAEVLSSHQKNKTDLVKTAEELVEEAIKRRKQNYYGLILVEKIEILPQITYISSRH